MHLTSSHLLVSMVMSSTKALLANLLLSLISIHLLTHLKQSTLLPNTGDMAHLIGITTLSVSYDVTYSTVVNQNQIFIT